MENDNKEKEIKKIIDDTRYENWVAKNKNFLIRFLSENMYIENYKNIDDTYYGKEIFSTVGIDICGTTITKTINHYTDTTNLTIDNLKARLNELEKEKENLFKEIIDLRYENESRKYQTSERI